MSEPTGEAPAIPTSRLVFDNSAISDENVPRFLRGKSVEPKELGERGEEEIVDVDEPETPVALIEPVEEVPAVSETPETEPSNQETEAPTLVEAVEQSTETDDDDLTVEQLKQQQEELDRKIKVKQEAEKKAVINQIVEVVKTYSIPVEELVEALGGMKIKRKGVKAKIKYQDPKTGATWSGRGKEPSWIKDKDRTPFLIKE